MTKSKEFIQATLVNRTNADCSTVEAKNNRWHYFLRFDEAIGWDWLYTQIGKAKRELGIELELWKVRPSGVNDFEIEVREVARREDIDDSQHNLSAFEQ